MKWRGEQLLFCFFPLMRCDVDDGYDDGSFWSFFLSSQLLIIFFLSGWVVGERERDQWLASWLAPRGCICLLYGCFCFPFYLYFVKGLSLLLSATIHCLVFCLADNRKKKYFWALGLLRFVAGCILHVCVLSTLDFGEGIDDGCMALWRIQFFFLFSSKYQCRMGDCVSE